MAAAKRLMKVKDQKSTNEVQVREPDPDLFALKIEDAISRLDVNSDHFQRMKSAAAETLEALRKSQATENGPKEAVEVSAADVTADTEGRSAIPGTTPPSTEKKAAKSHRFNVAVYADVVDLASAARISATALIEQAMREKVSSALQDSEIKSAFDRAREDRLAREAGKTPPKSAPSLAERLLVEKPTNKA